MTTDAGSWRDGEAILPDELLAAKDRRATQRRFAERLEERERRRRRFLPAAVVSASVLSIAGLADRFVSATLRPQPSSTTPASPPPAAARAAAPASSAALSEIARSLYGDRKAITALAQAQAQLARRAAAGTGTAALPSAELPSLPSLPSASSLSVPSLPPIASVTPPPPSTHATTGASSVVP